MLFLSGAVVSTPAYYFEPVHVVLLLIGLIALVALLIVWRIVMVRRRTRGRTPRG